VYGFKESILYPCPRKDLKAFICDPIPAGSLPFWEASDCLLQLLEGEVEIESVVQFLAKRTGPLYRIHEAANMDSCMCPPESIAYTDHPSTCTKHLHTFQILSLEEVRVKD